MKELDVLLERYVRFALPAASPWQLRQLERLLDFPDPVLIDYLLGQVIPADPELARLTRLIASVPSPE